MHWGLSYYQFNPYMRGQLAGPVFQYDSVWIGPESRRSKAMGLAESLGFPMSKCDRAATILNLGFMSGMGLSFNRNSAMGSWFSDATGINVDVVAGVDHIGRAIQEGIKHSYKQIADGLEHVRRQLAEQLGFSIDLWGFIEKSVLAVGTMIKGLVTLDWNMFGQGITQLSQSVGQFLMDINPLANSWKFLTAGKISQNLGLAKIVQDIDNFFGNAISRGINATQLLGRALRGDAITKEDLLDVLLTAAAVLCVVYAGPIWAAIKATGAFLWTGAKAVWGFFIGGLKELGIIKDSAEEEFLKKKMEEELARQRNPGAVGPAPVVPVEGQKPSTGSMVALGIGAGVLLWSLS